MNVTKLSLLATLVIVSSNLQAGYAKVLESLGTVAGDDAYKTSLMKAVFIQVPQAERGGAVKAYVLAANPGMKGGAANPIRDAKLKEIQDMLPKDEAGVRSQFVNLMTGAGQPGTALVAKFGKP